MSTPPLPPDTQSPSSDPLPPPPSSGGSAEMHPAVPAVVSLFAPGLGLLLLKTRDRVKDALLVFGIWVGGVMAVLLLSIVTFGIAAICCGVPLFLYNIAAAIHSYDEAILLEGDKPLLFQKGFRIFKD
jgi:hypothetical protein